MNESVGSAFCGNRLLYTPPTSACFPTYRACLCIEEFVFAALSQPCYDYSYMQIPLNTNGAVQGLVRYGCHASEYILWIIVCCDQTKIN